MKSNAIQILDRDFGNAYLRLLDDVGSRDGWVGLVHIARDLRVRDEDLCLWAWANAERLGLELSGQTARFAVVRGSRDRMRELLRDVAAVGLAFGIIALLVLGAGVLA